MIKGKNFEIEQFYGQQGKDQKDIRLLELEEQNDLEKQVKNHEIILLYIVLVTSLLCFYCVTYYFHYILE